MRRAAPWRRLPADRAREPATGRRGDRPCGRRQRSHRDRTRHDRRARAAAREALPLLEQAGDHADLVHVWDSSLRRRELPRPLRGVGARGGTGAPPRPASAGQRCHPPRFEARSSCGPRPADEALRTLDALLPDSRTPERCCRAPTCSRCSPASTRPGRSRTRQASAARELTGDDSGRVHARGHRCDSQGDHETAAVHYRAYCEAAR